MELKLGVFTPLLQTPPPTTPQSCQTMAAEIVPMFTGVPFATQSDVVTPATFIKKFMVHMRDIGIKENAAGDVRRIRTMHNYLVENSAAEKWYDKLKTDGTLPTMWEVLEAVFLLHFPGPVRVERTGQEWEREMAGMRLSLAEINTTVKVGNADVFVHVYFASRLLEVAKLAGIETTASGIWQSCNALPEVIHEKVPSTQASIKSVNRAHIREVLPRLGRRRTWSARSLSSRSARCRQMLCTPLTTLQATTAPVPMRVAADADTFGGTGGLGNLFTLLNTLTDVGRWHLGKIVKGLSGSMLLDDQAGRAEYARCIGGRNTVHGGKKVLLERTGFPLSPGTAPPLSGECFVCGKITVPWHRRDDCPRPKIPPK